MNGVSSFLEDRRAGFIMRWHARQTVRQESLAEHHYFVLHDAMVVYDALVFYGIDKKLDLEMPDKLDVLQMAHFHDAPEFVSGDISGAAKRNFPALRSSIQKVERMIADKLLFNELPDEMAEQYRGYAQAMTHQACSSLAQQIVKYADKLEAYLFAQTELHIGNTLMLDVVEQVRAEMLELQWPWLHELRKIAGVP